MAIRKLQLLIILGGGAAAVVDEAVVIAERVDKKVLAHLRGEAVQTGTESARTAERSFISKALALGSTLVHHATGRHVTFGSATAEQPSPSQAPTTSSSPSFVVDAFLDGTGVPRWCNGNDQGAGWGGGSANRCTIHDATSESDAQRVCWDFCTDEANDGVIGDFSCCLGIGYEAANFIALDMTYHADQKETWCCCQDRCDCLEENYRDWYNIYPSTSSISFTDVGTCT
mmetsp:Transcript_16654/g.49734  ORF Transcript_16654/g.49734 Transcript_16654/m.49734 type:complete len:229 (+) Transcript_16654:73-759(+)